MIFSTVIYTDLVWIYHLMIISPVYRGCQIFYSIDQRDQIQEKVAEVELIPPLYNQQTIYQVFHYTVDD